MRIGIIGAGMVGGTLAPLWVRAGHEVLVSSRHPERLGALVEELGKRARAGTPREAAVYGEVVFLAVPYGALPGLAQEVGPFLHGKVVLDACNPFPQRDGEVAETVRREGHGSGVGTARLLPGARVVKAFNTVYFRILASQAHRPGERVGVPLAGDDVQAVTLAARLVEDAGFTPVVVGPLERAHDFDPNTPVWNSGMTASQLRRALCPPPAPRDAPAGK